jgi:glycogen debranching enzyme
MEKKHKSDTFSTLATSSLTEEKTFALKHNNTFAIFNKYGDIVQFKNSAQGVFHEGTRFLSAFQLKIEGSLPLFLSSSLKERNEMFLVDLTNPDIIEEGVVKLEKDIIHIMRQKVLWQSVYYEHILFHNFGLEEVLFDVELIIDADFDDIFEVRGAKRLKKGIKLPLKLEKNSIRLGYVGVDGVERTTSLLLKPEPSLIEGNRVFYTVQLSPGQSFIVSPVISFETQNSPKPKLLNFRKAVKKQIRFLEYVDKSTCEIVTSNEQFNHWINRSATDLTTMISDTPYGPYPYAGIPWYVTPFGRDGIITALECLWVSPEVANGVLRYLAATQAKEIDRFRDSEPGKILHETREGEMAMLDEIPFRQYYGTIDATPLFIVLAGEYYKRTGDLELIEELWPNIELALEWIDKYGDIDGDMFVEYQRKEESGLFNQGWKDSYDSISYENGKIADLPIALCEVQGYVYDAWLKASMLAEVLGYMETAEELKSKASELQQQFSKHFWSAKKSTFHLALADNKKPCNVVSSNAGHCLFSGIATHEQAKMVAQSLLSDEMFTGWGIRTLSSRELRYNPMSYHNGSVWPHDNALIAYGLSKYGLKEEVAKITAGLFDASLFSEGQRLPELFCGFKRKPGEAPTSYPVACSPQAWSVATVFMTLQALLGMEIIESKNIIRFYKPYLPEFLNSVHIKNLHFGKLKLNLEFTRAGNSVSISMHNKNVPVKLEVIY